MYERLKALIEKARVPALITGKKWHVLSVRVDDSDLVELTRIIKKYKIKNRQLFILECVRDGIALAQKIEKENNSGDSQ
jgi:hypothetical protein